MSKPEYTKHVLLALQELFNHGDQPRSVFNSGVAKRLEDSKLVITYFARSPFASSRSKEIPYLKLTDLGRVEARRCL